MNVALLVPEVNRATRARLVGALTEHYGSPGRLADYRRQFERTTRHEWEDPLTFAIALETLAVKLFGDMGVNARLRLIWDRFVAGHEHCALRRHLDSVPPETPIWDIVDRCRVWESHADTGIRRIVKPVPEKALGRTGLCTGRPSGGGCYRATGKQDRTILRCCYVAYFQLHWF